MSKASEPQPDPCGEGVYVLPFVIQDIAERAAAGVKKYGTLLRTHNGRDPMWDAYQEAIDLVMYLRQAILERDMGAGEQNTDNNYGEVECHEDAKETPGDTRS